MKKLIRLLKQAHAVEIGAYHAYEGHWRSLDAGSNARKKIKQIQADELEHKMSVERMLKELNSKPNKVLGVALWIIGKTISALCHVMGYKMAMFGAKIMEVMGKNIYKKLAREARNECYVAMAIELDSMQRSEESHEEYFKSVLKPPCTCKHLWYLNGNVAREINPECKMPEANHRY